MNRIVVLGLVLLAAFVAVAPPAAAAVDLAYVDRAGDYVTCSARHWVAWTIEYCGTPPLP